VAYWLDVRGVRLFATLVGPMHRNRAFSASCLFLSALLRSPPLYSRQLDSWLSNLDKTSAALDRALGNAKPPGQLRHPLVGQTGAQGAG
jgi:hypothetical protein